jgi:large subunit ribosomal protein L22
MKSEDVSMQTKATIRYIRTSPRKARQVVDLIRGKKVNDALDVLAYTERKAARIVEKLLKSAIANAEEKSGGKADIDTFVIKGAKVDGGPTLKRFMPRARGRATKIRKRTSHITLMLENV